MGPGCRSRYFSTACRVLAVALRHFPSLQMPLHLRSRAPHRLELLAGKERELVGAVWGAGARRVPVCNERHGVDGRAELHGRLVRVTTDGAEAPVACRLEVHDAEHTVAAAGAAARQVERVLA